MSGGTYADRRRNDNIAESKKQVADALEGMAGSIEAQDKAIKDIACIANNGIQEAQHVADRAKANASEAKAVAQAAQAHALECDRRITQHVEMSILAKLQWLFRGPLW